MAPKLMKRRDLFGRIDALRSLVLLATIHLFGALGPAAPTALAALPDPGFWDTTEDELARLVSESRGYILPPARLGNGAKLCDKLPGYEDEAAYKLTNATVVTMDEDLLCADFAVTCSLSRKEKDEWILERAAWFSAPHISTGIDDIPHDASRAVTARRLCAGGRALIFPSSHGGLAVANDQGDGTSAAAAAASTAAGAVGPEWIDVKGVGAKDPKPHSEGANYGHCNGLLPLFDALYEYLNEKTVEAILRHHAKMHPNEEDQSFHTVGIYAVLSLGFAYPWETISSGVLNYPAGGLVRQASRRHPNPHGWMAAKEAEIAEQILNTYGIKTDGHHSDVRFRLLPNPTCRRINMQGTIMPRTITDFNTFQIDHDEWPPGEDDCLVHWGNTARIINATLWHDVDVAAPIVREFLRREKYNDDGDPSRKLGVWPARGMHNIWTHRFYDAQECFWHGRCSLAYVEALFKRGAIDHLLSGKKLEGNLTNECKADAAQACV